MRAGNLTDGVYLIFLLIPFVLSLWIGDVLRKKILYRLALSGYYGQTLSGFIGILAEILIIITGISIGLLLVEIF
jgi:hypothetical protein